MHGRFVVFVTNVHEKRTLTGPVTTETRTDDFDVALRVYAKAKEDDLPVRVWDNQQVKFITDAVLSLAVMYQERRKPMR